MSNHPWNFGYDQKYVRLNQDMEDEKRRTRNMHRAVAGSLLCVAAFWCGVVVLFQHC